MTATRIDESIRARPVVAFGLAMAGLVVVATASMALGPYPVAPQDVARVLFAALAGGDAAVGDNARAIVMQVRGPRVLAALAVGAALSAAGASYQNLFRNPLVAPDILGVSAGCALGAVAGIFLGLPIAAVQGLAFAGGIAAVSLVLAIGAWVRGHDRVLTLVLTGVVVGSLFGAGVAFAKYVADPYNQLPAITFWLLGSFAGVLPRDLELALPLLAVALVPLVLLRWRVNVLSLPDDEARALGVDVARTRLVVIAAATLATSASVAIAGVVGWVGLVMPHAARLLVGAQFSRVLPMSALLGAAFLLFVDTLCRTATRSELPPGVLTALVGTPVFIWLLAATFRRAA
ncbi:MAG TPA: iron ABC transporter permease [Usitatibacter sp.]|nr:iron ABC transporter permease [Usitatibacter sp.]